MIERRSSMEDLNVSRPYRRDVHRVPITALYEDPLFANLFLRDKTVVAAIAADMKKHGYNPNEPMVGWRDARGRGRHTLVDGYTRLTAARKAGLTEVVVTYQECASRLEALLWAAEKQGRRRNISKEVQCLSLVRALQSEPEFARATTKELVKTLQFSAPTIDRARLLLKH